VRVPALDPAGSAQGARDAHALRAQRLPQLVGMVAAARVLAREVADVLAADAEVLADRRAVQATLGCDEPTATRLCALLTAWAADQARRASARCEACAAVWLAEAHRVEGRIEALDELAAGTPEP